MDDSLLALKGINSTEVAAGFVDGYVLRIGERATLLRHRDGRAFGVTMDIARPDVMELYAEESVADYQPESVTVELMDGTRVEATCYNLPGARATETNKVYAERLLRLAARLGLPDSYLDEIRQAIEGQ